MKNPTKKVSFLKNIYKYISILIILFLFIGLTSCEKTKLTGTNKISQLDGRANDGDAQNGGMSTYSGAVADMAIDNKTVAISGTATYNSLSGITKSIPGPNAGDGSHAVSNNKVSSTFQPAEAGDYAFEFKPVIDIKLLNGGKGELQIGGKILKANGDFLSGSAFQRTYKFKQNNTNLDVELIGSGLSTTQTSTTANNSNFVPPASDGQGSNISLKAEQYTIVFEMNIQAISPSAPNNQPKPEAHVSASTTFDLK